MNNPPFGDYLHLIYTNEIEVKDTTDKQMSASYLDIHLEVGNVGRLKTKLYDKRDDFIFLIVNFPFISSNIPAVPAYGVHIAYSICDYRASAQYSDVLGRATAKLLVVCSHLLSQHYKNTMSSALTD